MTESESSVFSLLLPEQKCQYMYDYFEKTGISSHVEKIDGFAFPFEALVRSTLTYPTINEYFSDSLSEEELKDLVWGN